MGDGERAELKVKVAQACRILYMEELFQASGHISARVPGTDHILIHPRQTSRAAVEAKDIVAVDLRGRLVEGEMEPPSETSLHTAMYRARPDIMAVAHLHSHYATIISIAGRPLVPVQTSAAIFAPQVPVFDDPSLIQNDEQGDSVARALGQSIAVLLRGHGSVLVAPSIESVVAASIHFEQNAKKLFDASLLGTPRAITPEEAKPMADRVWGEKPNMKVWLHHLAKARALGVI